MLLIQKDYIFIKKKDIIYKSIYLDINVYQSKKTNETIINETFLFEKITDSFLPNLLLDRNFHKQLLNKLVE